MTENIELLGTAGFNDTEADEAKTYWANRPFDYYKRNRPWTDFMADEILALQPESVFELGCNAGKNLLALKRRNREIFLAGVDINRGAVDYGRSEGGLSLLCADERALEIMPAKTYDVTFTVSVLDHVPKPGSILENLARISRKAVLLLEPFVGEEGKVVRNIDRRTGEWIDTTPFSYSWDYPRLISEHLPGWSFEVRDFAMDSNLGRFYKYYKLLRLTTGQRDSQSN